MMHELVTFQEEEAEIVRGNQKCGKTFGRNVENGMNKK